MSGAPGLAWRDSIRALDLVRSGNLSLTVRARAGAVRDALLALIDPEDIVRITADSDPEALGGGIDLLASLAGGRPVLRTALADRVAGKLLLVAGAERTPGPMAAMLAEIIDARVAGVVLLDEGIGDERLPAMLEDRAAMLVDLDPVSIRDLESPEPQASREPVADPAAALCEVAAALGIASVRPALHGLTVARASAQTDGRSTIDEGDCGFAVRVSLAPRATCVPGEDQEQDDEREAETAPPPTDAPPDNGAPADDGQAVEDRLLDAARAAIPADLLHSLASQGMGGRQSGSAMAKRGSGARGRSGPPRPGLPRRGARLDLAATLIAAAPMQRLRGRTPGERIAVRKDDIRVRRPQPRQISATIFAVDASGSAAVARLAEVKGAVEQLLAQSYVRRDEVALIAFRGESAQTLLPPTRSLARAKRELAALPGGGPTPLADGIVAALREAIRSREAGRAPLLLIITDGGANVARDGSKGRAVAREDAQAAARLVAAAGVDALVIDSSPRGQDRVRELADAMHGRYFALPRLDDTALAGIVASAR